MSALNHLGAREYEEVDVGAQAISEVNIQPN